MSPDMSIEEFCENLGVEMVQLQAGVPSLVTSNVHRDLVDKLNISLPISDTGAIIFKKINSEVLEQFVVWLYSTTRSKLIFELKNIPLMLDLYKLARSYGIVHLEEDCLFAFAQFPPVFQIFESICQNSDDPHLHSLISDALTGAIELMGGFEGPGIDDPRDVVTLVHTYIFGLELGNPSLCNAIMDALQEYMEAAFVFTGAEIYDIFRRTHWCPWARIRNFCCALIHYQHNMTNSTGDQEYIGVHELENYLRVPGFRKHYREYEQAFRGFDTEDIPSWDPRIQGGFDKCYFHHHSLATDDDHRADYGTDASESGGGEESEEDEEEEDEDGEQGESESEERDEEMVVYDRPHVADLKRKAEESEEEDESQDRRKMQRTS